jgi:hypothetical protein
VRNLPEARVARLVECHTEQKAGYNPGRQPLFGNQLAFEEKLGQRNVNSTMFYTHIIEFDEESQNYHHATANDEKEAGELLDNGWTYILTTPQNIMMFRKRK